MQVGLILELFFNTKIIFSNIISEKFLKYKQVFLLTVELDKPQNFRLEKKYFVSEDTDMEDL